MKLKKVAKDRYVSVEDVAGIDYSLDMSMKSSGGKTFYLILKSGVKISTNYKTSKELIEDLKLEVEQ